MIYLHFRVVTYAANWCTWLVTVPLLTHISLIPELGKFPGHDDMIAIICSFSMIVAGLCMQINGMPSIVTAMFFLLSCTFYLIMMYYVYLSNSKEYSIETSMANEDRQNLQKIKRQLCSTLVIAELFFPVVYLLAACKVLDPNMTLIAFLLLDVISKGFMAFTAMDSHLLVLHTMQNDLKIQQVANTRKRAFLKYMFHELRIPLNALSMGLDCSDDLNSVNSEAERPLDGNSSRDRNSMQRVAVDYMETSLNSYLVIQQIEEGVFADTFVNKEFDINFLLHSVVSDLNIQFQQNNIEFQLEVDPTLPTAGMVLGDVDKMCKAVRSVIGRAAERCQNDSKFPIECRLLKESRASVSTSSNVSQWSAADAAAADAYVVEVTFQDSIPITSIQLEDERLKYTTTYGSLFTGDLLHAHSSGMSLVIALATLNMYNGCIEMNKSASASSGEGIEYRVEMSFPRSDDPFVGGVALGCSKSKPASTAHTYMYMGSPTGSSSRSLLQLDHHKVIPVSEESLHQDDSSEKNNQDVKVGGSTAKPSPRQLLADRVLCVDGTYYCMI